jgi:hypothetical protein
MTGELMTVFCFPFWKQAKLQGASPYYGKGYSGPWPFVSVIQNFKMERKCDFILVTNK